MLSILFPVLSLLFPIVLSAPAETVCDSSTGICLHQLFDPKTQITLGLAIPSASMANADPFADDFLASVSFALPYGFAGFSTTTDPTESTISQFSLNIVMTRAAVSQVLVPANGLGTLLKNGEVLIAQLSTMASNGSALIPTTTQKATVTLSELSSFTTTHATLIFRCQNCTLLSGTTAKSNSLDHMALNIYRSTTAVQYLSDTTYSTVFPLTGNLTVDTVSFNVGDVATKDYEMFLKAAGVA